MCLLLMLHGMEYELFCAKRPVVIITWASWGIRTSCPLSMCYLGHFASSFLFIKSPLSALLLTPSTNMRYLWESDMLFLCDVVIWGRPFPGPYRWIFQPKGSSKTTHFLTSVTKLYNIGNQQLVLCSAVLVLFLSISVDAPPNTAGG